MLAYKTGSSLGDIVVGALLAKGFQLIGNRFVKGSTQGASTAATGGAKLLNQFNSVESLLQNAGKFSRVKGGAQQAFIRGDGASVFKTISQGGTR